MLLSNTFLSYELLCICHILFLDIAIVPVYILCCMQLNFLFHWIARLQDVPNMEIGLKELYVTE